MAESASAQVVAESPGFVPPRERSRLRRWPIISVGILLLFAIAAAFAPWLSPHDPLVANLRARNTPPFWMSGGSTEYILGADTLGRDVLSRIIHGARVSVVIAAVALSTGIVFGTVLGLVAGYYGRTVDEIIIRFTDVNASIPFLLLALIVIMVVGQSFMVIVFVLAYGTWSAFTRQVRGEAMSLREADYVALAKVAGASDFRILFRHILPGVSNTIIVVATLHVGSLILSEAILSFLGAGIPPPTPAWGAMIAQGRVYLASAWWIAFFPGLAIFLLVVALNFMGDWMRDHFDPRLRQVL